MGMWGDPHLGVLLYYESIRNKQWTNCYSIGDPALQQKWTRTLHGDLMPAWLYISFRDAWPPVKEFMETDGELPKCINWINSRDIPPNTFPDPYPRTIVAINDDLP